MNEPTSRAIQSLMLPIETFTLLLPSTMVAEVVGLNGLSPVPAAKPWTLGILAWRGLQVPVISFEALADRPSARPKLRSRIVVCYPLPGRPARDFLGILSSNDPQSRLVAETDLEETGEVPTHPCVAQFARLKDTEIALPDIEALTRMLYPD